MKSPEYQIKSFLFTCCILLSSIALNAQVQPEIKQRFTPSQLKKDFKILRGALEDVHPGLDWYVSRDSMLGLFDDFESKLSASMTQKEFLLELEPLIAQIKCGHTDIFVSKKEKKLNAKRKKYQFPFEVKTIDNKLYVMKHYGRDSLPPGTEILSINELSKDQILNRLKDIVKSDGYNISYKTNVINRVFPQYHRYTFGEYQNYAMKVRKLDGEVEDILVKSILVDPAKKKKKKKSEKSAAADASSIKPIYSMKKHSFYLSPQDSSVAILRIEAFTAFHKTFYRRVFRYLEQNDVPNLVIDIRNNGGGNGEDSFHVLKYLIHNTQIAYSFDKHGFRPPYNKYLSQQYSRNILMPFVMPLLGYKKQKKGHRKKVIEKRTKHHYDGSVFLLINGGSFSASCVVAAYLKEDRSATIIGEETGGGMLGTNALIMPMLTLPYSKIRLRLPLFKLTHEVSTVEKGRGVRPHYPINYSLEDYLEKKDLEMELMYELAQ